MSDDLKADVAQLTSRVQNLEAQFGTPAFAAQFKQQLKEASSIPEFKSAVQAEISSWKAGQDVEHYGGHENILAKTETVGGKAEATGVKAEATAAQLGVFGYQAEFGLFKQEFSLNKLWEDRKQQKREQDVDRRLAGLTFTDRQLREQLSSLKTKLGKVSQVANDGNQRSISGRAKVRDLTGDVTALVRTQQAGARRVRSQISSLKSKISRISQVANDANERSKSLRIKANNLDQQVRAGLRRVEALEDGARRAGRSVESLRGAINSLERALRD